MESQGAGSGIEKSLALKLENLDPQTGVFIWGKSLKPSEHEKDDLTDLPHETVVRMNNVCEGVTANYKTLQGPRREDRVP